MTTASASSLVLPSLNPKTLSLSNPNKPISLSFRLHAKSISVPSSLFCSFVVPFKQQQQQPFSRFVPNVAVSSEFEQQEDVSSDGDEPSFSEDLKLFVGNLPFSVDSAQLAGLFEKAGNVQMVEVIYDKVTGRSRGFGFVTMSSVEEAESAAQQFNGYELEGRALRVNSGPPPQKDSRTPRFGGFGGGGGGGQSLDGGNRLYVGNLPWSVDNFALESFFSEQGKVVDAKVIYDRESGRSKGFGFVTYSSAEEVENALESLNGAELDGREIRVSVAESRPRRQF